ncbi:hypothetical protein GCM10022243_20630 [Saccharothrix violaceirubra]|uniref:PH (Pleckstrin Homology) domain-containing protein n=1 Tax=Saccharothrix violaceirubra TaxID=413306 RepID=A0A7W7T1W9_9PSEU|nr:hypothetical protein [Saccharothrix violaceirubra]MBB4965033.1 hypothetical protein [Saccharothrix violaceirubra]
MAASPPTGRYSIYTGRVTNWPLVVVLGTALLVPLLLLGTLSRGDRLDPAGPAIPLAVAAGALLVLVLTGLNVRTAAGPNGITVRCGVLGRPRRTYRLADVDRAEVIDLKPTLSRVSFGYWWTPRRTFYTVRTGPALRLTLHNGRSVTITVPDPLAAITAIHEAKGQPRT